MGEACTPADSLVGIPNGLRDPLISTYAEIVRNFREQRWEPSELNGGKLCEVVYTILRGYVDGSFATKPSKPPNMVDACRGFEQEVGFPRSVRIHIPRMLIALYEVRSNRGVSHTGGDVDPNHMDAIAVLYMAKWVIGELVRIFHNVDTAAASAMVDAIVERELPLIWLVGHKKRVLAPKMTYRNKTLVLLYGEHEPVTEEALFDWVEHSRLADFRKVVLRPLHRAKLIEYDDLKKTAALSPLGAVYVEDKILIKATKP